MLSEFMIRDAMLVYTHHTTMTADEIIVKKSIDKYIAQEKILIEEHVLINIGLDGM